MGNPISKGIPWDVYSELEIQTFLKMHFETLAFEVTWRHQDDPANEEGVDLECTRDLDNQKVLIVVKKKPKKEAPAQLVELADQPATKRIYVYTEGAAQSFRRTLMKFEPKVEFWDETKLEGRLNDSGLTLQLKIANSRANDEDDGEEEGEKYDQNENEGGDSEERDEHAKEQKNSLAVNHLRRCHDADALWK